MQPQNNSQNQNELPPIDQNNWSPANQDYSTPPVDPRAARQKKILIILVSALVLLVIGGGVLALTSGNEEESASTEQNSVPALQGTANLVDYEQATFKMKHPGNLEKAEDEAYGDRYGGLVSFSGNGESSEYEVTVYVSDDPDYANGDEALESYASGNEIQNEQTAEMTFQGVPTTKYSGEYTDPDGKKYKMVYVNALVNNHYVEFSAIYNEAYQDIANNIDNMINSIQLKQ